MCPLPKSKQMQHAVVSPLAPYVVFAVHSLTTALPVRPGRLYPPGCVAENCRVCTGEGIAAWAARVAFRPNGKAVLTAAELHAPRRRVLDGRPPGHGRLLPSCYVGPPALPVYCRHQATPAELAAPPVAGRPVSCAPPGGCCLFPCEEDPVMSRARCLMAALATVLGGL